MNKTYMHDTGRKPEKNTRSNTWKLELLALSGFCISGIFFIVSGVQNGDYLTVAGSLVWIASCLCWMAPYKRHF